MPLPDDDPILTESRLPSFALGGADQELGNFIEGFPDPDNACAPAAAALLAEIDGIPDTAASATYDPAKYSSALQQSLDALDTHASPTINPVDYGRRFLACNGGCIYVDMGHLEVCLPEISSAQDFVAYWHACLKIVRRAQLAANARLPMGQRLHVLINSSDGLGNSFGQHLNLAVPRRTFEDLFSRKIHYGLFLAAYQVSSIIFTGQGKVGAENARAPVAYQLGARADFFESLLGVQTTYRRPILNLRDEPICGTHPYRSMRPNAPARLHVIPYDANLSHVANYLKFGVLQLIVDLIAADRVDPRLILQDAVGAFVGWSHDITLTKRMSTLGGEQLTALEFQFAFHELAKKFVETGQCVVPHAANILHLWGDTLAKLQARDFPALARRLDWVLKLSAIQNALQRRPDLNFHSPAIKYLDHMYGSLDPETGLFWSFQRAGMVESVVSDDEITHAQSHPPAGTRAWGRAMLLRWAGPTHVDAMDWDYIRFRFPVPGRPPILRTLDMSNPWGMSRANVESRLRGVRSLAEALDRLGVPPEDPPLVRRYAPLPASTSYQWNQYGNT